MVEKFSNLMVIPFRIKLKSDSGEFVEFFLGLFKQSTGSF
jgi:hypothetical protein